MCLSGRLAGLLSLKTLACDLQVHSLYEGLLVVTEYYRFCLKYGYGSIYSAKLVVTCASTLNPPLSSSYFYICGYYFRPYKQSRVYAQNGVHVNVISQIAHLAPKCSSGDSNSMADRHGSPTKCEGAKLYETVVIESVDAGSQKLHP